MSDSLRRQRAIRDALLQLYPTTLTARQARHLTTRAALISGSVGSRRTHLPASASKLPDGTKRERRLKRFQRWLSNPQVTAERSLLPFAQALIQRRAHCPLVLVIDGSSVGRGCLALVVSLVYQGRALPLAGLVVAQPNGHVDGATHLPLLDEVQALVPPESSVVLLGDGEFDGPERQAALPRLGWRYGWRTAKNIQIQREGEWLSLADGQVEAGPCVGLPDVRMTLQAYGPVLVMGWWGRDQREPLQRVTHLELVAEACWWYRKRFRIETFFSAHKRRGFHRQRSHLADPARLARLLLAAWLASLWIISLGVLAQRDGWQAIIHRGDRCDVSLFQLGLALLDHLLNDGFPIPVAFRPPPLETIESVRQ